MKCRECGNDLVRVEVAVEGADSKAISLQCPACGYMEFEEESSNKIINELKSKRIQMKDVEENIVVEINELQKFKQEKLAKNDRLKKYEIKIGEIDTDIYVSYFSKLAIPVENIEKYSSNVDGFRVALPEVLLVLKQGAWLDRKYSIKGEKDKIDIVSLLFFTDVNFFQYSTLLKKYGLVHYINELILLVKGFMDYDSLSLMPREFKLKKKSIIENLKKI